MPSEFWPVGGVQGVLHHYTETLVAFEFNSSKVPKPNSLVFVGGLGDGLATTSYLAEIVKALEPTSWSVFNLTLSSSYTAWGLAHLDRDTNELAQCINYIYGIKGERADAKIVLMGHSTGSQDVLHYLYRPNPEITVHAFDSSLKHIPRPRVHGAILQAPVSDREAIRMLLETGWDGKSPEEAKAVFHKLMSTSREYELQDQSFDRVLPGWATKQIGYPAGTPVSARRFLSLNTAESDDDLFSSDLSDSRLQLTFGQIGKQGLLAGKLLVLHSGADQSVPAWVDREELLSRWRQAVESCDSSEVWDDQSCIIRDASHALSNDDQAGPRKELVQLVSGYLDRTLAK